ncbi:MAG: tetratricopeptide repeat protein [Myxococcales bacterium]|nr:tetratricopeptide repeat protein [Myxococcales bacterium]
MSILSDPADLVAPYLSPPTTLDKARQALFAGRAPEAIQLFQTVVRADNNHGEALHGLGLSLLQLGRPREAVEWVAAAHLAQPNDMETLRNLGTILTRLWRLERAVECFSALVERSNLSRDMDLLGSTLCLMGRYADGYPWLEKAEAHEPNNPTRRPSLLQARAAMFHWDRYYEDRDVLEFQLRNDAQKYPCTCTPFTAIILNLPENTIHTLAKNQGHRATTSVPSALVHQRSSSARQPKRKCRIGYLSPDFHCHPVGLLLAPILEAHDKLEFEIITYPLRTVDDHVRTRIEQAADTIRPVDDLDDQTIANYISADKIDILVDLMGFTNTSKPGVLARHPAPVQTHFLGYPGTMPRSLIDYQVLHHSRLGPGCFDDYDESLALLPETFIASEGFPSPSYIPSRRELGLPEDQFIFGFFGAAYRIDPAVFDAWITIVNAVPDSILWIQNGHKAAQQKILYEAQQRGLDPQRIFFCDWGLLSEQWHHTHADLWLDGWHVSSGTACIIAVWTGTPLLSLAGNSPQSRTGAAVLSGARLHELICDNKESYIQRAIFLGQHPKELRSIREKMQTQRAGMPLFKVERFTRHLESAFHTMMQAQNGHQPPTSFSVLPLP